MATASQKETRKIFIMRGLGRLLGNSQQTNNTAANLHSDKQPTNKHNFDISHSNCDCHLVPLHMSWLKAPETRKRKPNKISGTVKTSVYRDLIPVLPTDSCDIKIISLIQEHVGLEEDLVEVADVGARLQLKKGEPELLHQP